MDEIIGTTDYAAEQKQIGKLGENPCLIRRRIRSHKIGGCSQDQSVPASLVVLLHTVEPVQFPAFFCRSKMYKNVNKQLL